MQKNLFFLSVSILLFPFLTFAQTVQNLLGNVTIFINNILIPVLFTIAFIAFIYNVIRYFVIGADNEKDREIAKTYAIYSVAAFFFISIFWGIVDMVDKSIGITDKTAPCSDYVKTFKPSNCP